jgi:hypothetical protein
MVTDKDKGYSAILDTLHAAAGARVLVGVRGAENSDVLQYAAANEFGTEDGRVPERSFLRSTIDENHERYGKLMRIAVLKVIRGKASPEEALGIVGIQVVGDVQRKIRSHVPPPNAPSTIAAKGSSVTLIDSGRLRQSIDYVVELG